VSIRGLIAALVLALLSVFVLLFWITQGRASAQDAPAPQAASMILNPELVD
jgi:hypothetical protein